MHKFSELLAELDVLTCFASTALKNDYCRPIIVDTPIIILEDGRHAVVEQLQTETGFIPNSVNLGQSELHIITGPNMSGKCVVPDTLVFSDKGILPIKSFKPDNIRPESFQELEVNVMGIKGRAKTSHFYYDGFRSTKRITTRRGYVIEDQSPLRGLGGGIREDMMNKKYILLFNNKTSVISVFSVANMAIK